DSGIVTSKSPEYRVMNVICTSAPLLEILQALMPLIEMPGIRRFAFMKMLACGRILLRLPLRNQRAAAGASPRQRSPNGRGRAIRAGGLGEKKFVMWTSPFWRFWGLSMGN